jgi:hypothetical protein
VHERRSPGHGQARSKDDAFELELLAAVGLIPPAVLDIAPVMVPVTAVCWVLLMVGAMITHGRPGQFKFVMLNSVYLLLAAFIAWAASAPRLSAADEDVPLEGRCRAGAVCSGRSIAARGWLSPT